MEEALYCGVSDIMSLKFERASPLKAATETKRGAGSLIPVIVYL